MPFDFSLIIQFLVCNCAYMFCIDNKTTTTNSLDSKGRLKDFIIMLSFKRFYTIIGHWELELHYYSLLYAIVCQILYPTTHQFFYYKYKDNLHLWESN